MKKNKFILLIFSLMFMFVGVVSAKENPFIIDWKDTDKATTYNLIGMLDTNLVYGDGYVTFHIDMNKYNSTVNTVVRMYNHKGNLETEEVLDNQIVFNAVTDGEYIYTLQRDIEVSDPISTLMDVDDSETAGVKVVKYNSSLKTKKEYEFTKENFNSSYDMFEETMIIQYLGKILGYNTMNVVDDTLYILSYRYSMFEFDSNLNKPSFIASTQNPESSRVKKYFEQLYYTYKIKDITDKGIISLDVNNQNIAYTNLSCIPDIASIVSGNSSYSGPEDSCDLVGSIGLTDVYENKLWEKELEHDLLAVNVKLIGDYVVAIGLSEDGTEILVYDLEGNLVQTITSDVVGYSNLVPNKNGFIVSKNLTDFDDCYAIENGSLYEEISDESQERLYEILMNADECATCALYSTTEVYQLPYNINVLTTGEGEVDVDNDAYVGVEVEVKVSPKLGWLVEQIVVIDEDGNEVEVKDNKFIMPDSSVTIEVTFKKIVESVIENPNTAAIPITGLGLIVIILGIITYRNYKKIKFLK